MLEGTDLRRSDLSGARLDPQALSRSHWQQARGIDPSRLIPEGFGEDRPIEDNGTPEGREINRRVEFHIIK